MGAMDRTLVQNISKRAIAQLPALRAALEKRTAPIYSPYSDNQMGVVLDPAWDALRHVAANEHWSGMPLGALEGAIDHFFDALPLSLPLKLKQDYYGYKGFFAASPHGPVDEAAVLAATKVCEAVHGY